LADTAQSRLIDGMSGDTVGERYRLTRRIATGGMAEVYAASDAIDGREVALKILPQAQHGESVSRFRREAEAVAALNHPHIVTVFDWGAHDGTHYIAMEYLRGPNLKQLIDERGALPEDRALQITEQLADALQFAHERHIIHRDVKPHNVLIDGDGNAKLADFGIARIMGALQLTQTRSILGTAQYLSPEQASGGQLDERTDVYSLGVVLFEMLAGQVPFAAESPVAVALKHTHEAVPRLRAINLRVSPDAEAIVQKAMAKDPSQRYQTAAEMRDAIRAAQAAAAALREAATTRLPPVDSAAIAGPVVVPTASVRPRASAWHPRTAVPVWLLPLVLAMLLLGAVVAFGRVAVGVAVPDVRGLTETEAGAELEQAGLQLEVAGALASAQVPRGRVISQEPEPGARIGRDEAVRVAISTGRGLIGVPNIVGRPEAEALGLLRQAGLGVGNIRQAPSDSVPAGRVAQQSPTAGSEVPLDSGIDIVMSAGRSPVLQQNQPPSNRGRGRGRGRDD
jgi:eukaryotic-like serine/threonine-protein kinase